MQHICGRTGTPPFRNKRTTLGRLTLVALGHCLSAMWGPPSPCMPDYGLLSIVCAIIIIPLFHSWVMPYPTPPSSSSSSSSSSPPLVHVLSQGAHRTKLQRTDGNSPSAMLPPTRICARAHAPVNYRRVPRLHPHPHHSLCLHLQHHL